MNFLIAENFFSKLKFVLTKGRDEAISLNELGIGNYG
jgi:hypothetical protein